MLVKDNGFFVENGQQQFNLMSNACDYFEIGKSEGEDVWLEGKIVEGEFVFNGRLFLREGGGGTVIDSFPKGHLPESWQQVRRLDAPGYELLDPDGESVFSYRIEDNVCSVEVNLYSKDGQLAANSGQGGLVLHVPAMLGRDGLKFG